MLQQQNKQRYFIQQPYIVKLTTSLVCTLLSVKDFVIICIVIVITVTITTVIIIVVAIARLHTRDAFTMLRQQNKHWWPLLAP